jgi:hypothetical protein
MDTPYLVVETKFEKLGYLANTWNMAKLHICFGYVNRETGRSEQTE